MFVAKDIYSIPTTTGFHAYYDKLKREFTMYATEPWDKSDQKKSLSFKFNNSKLSNNTLNDSNYVQVVISQRFQLDEYYYTTSSHAGTLNITRLDTSANIVSGTFSFQAVSKTNASSAINITDGRFDGKY